jgi:beta-lactam-binding protein with PASTA domain
MGSNEWKRSLIVLGLFLAACGSGKVPNLVDVSESEASGLLAKAGLQTGTVKLEVANESKIGKVMSQAPPAGSRISGAPDGAVDFVVGSIATPMLAGRTADEATLELNRVGLVLGNVRVTPELTGSGHVKDQNPAPGAPVRRGTPVEITIATSLISEKVKDGILDQLLSSDIFKKLNEADRQKIEQALRRH